PARVVGREPAHVRARLSDDRGDLVAIGDVPAVGEERLVEAEVHALERFRTVACDALRGLESGQAPVRVRGAAPAVDRDTVVARRRLAARPGRLAIGALKTCARIRRG